MFIGNCNQFQTLSKNTKVTAGEFLLSLLSLEQLARYKKTSNCFEKEVHLLHDLLLHLPYLHFHDI